MRLFQDPRWPSVVLLLATVVLGCDRPPQASPENLRMIAALRTALSAENSEWLDQNEAVLEERHASGQLSAEEHQEFQRIITMAREGRWKEAEQRAIAFQEAQRPLRP